MQQFSRIKIIGNKYEYIIIVNSQSICGKSQMTTLMFVSSLSENLNRIGKVY